MSNAHQTYFDDNIRPFFVSSGWDDQEIEALFGAFICGSQFALSVQTEEEHAQLCGECEIFRTMHSAKYQI